MKFQVGTTFSETLLDPLNMGKNYINEQLRTNYAKSQNEEKDDFHQECFSKVDTAEERETERNLNRYKKSLTNLSKEFEMYPNSNSKKMNPSSKYLA